MGFIKYIGALAMLTIFVMAIISFATGYADDNDAVVNVADDSRLSLTNIESEVDSFKLQVNSSSRAFAESGIDAGDETSRTGGVWKSITAMYKSVKHVLGMGSDVIFGTKEVEGRINPGIVLTILGAFLTVVAIALSWKAWAGKNPE